MEVLQNRETTRGVDMISCLPEGLLHNIMASLSAMDLTRISAVSKTFQSAWKTFPIIDLDFTTFEKSNTYSTIPREEKLELFLSFTHDLLLHRGKSSDLPVRILRFTAPLDHFVRDERVDYIIHFASLNNVQILELDANGERKGINQGGFGQLPCAVFFVRMLKVLKLRYFCLGPPMDLDLSETSIQELSLNNCVGLRSIKFRSSCLKSIKVEDCFTIKKIKVECPNLAYCEINKVYHQFSFYDYLLDVKFARCKSLRKLKLKDVPLCDSSFEHILLQCPTLEYLKLKNCIYVKNLKIGNNSLKTLQLKLASLEKVDVFAPNIQEYVHTATPSAPCEINIVSCKFLRRLLLEGVCITNEWIEVNMPRLPFLEVLCISHSTSLRKLRFCHERIETFCVFSAKLVEVDIDAPRLQNFWLFGQPPPSTTLIRRCKEHAAVCYDTLPTTIKSYVKLMGFLGSLNHFRSLIFTSSKGLNFPLGKIKRELFPCLNNFKSLSIVDADKTTNFCDLLAGLLWLVPLPETINILDDKFRILKRLEFKYYEAFDQEDDNTLCCLGHSIKCWRHYASEVTLEDFEASDVEGIFKEFIIRNALRLQKAPQYLSCSSQDKIRLNNVFESLCRSS